MESGRFREARPVEECLGVLQHGDRHHGLGGAAGRALAQGGAQSEVDTSIISATSMRARLLTPGFQGV